MALSARLVVVLTALYALQPVYAAFPSSCDSQGITDQDSCTAFCDPDDGGKKKGMWLGDPGPGACTCTGCLFCQTCANPKPQDDETAEAAGVGHSFVSGMAVMALLVVAAAMVTMWRRRTPAPVQEDRNALLAKTEVFSYSSVTPSSVEDL